METIEYTPTIGLKVSHHKYGFGTIKEIHGDNGRCGITCDFDDDEKTFLLLGELKPARSFKINRAILFFASDCQINEMEIRRYFTELAVEKFISDGYLTEIK